MATDISKLGVKTKWQDLTEGMIVASPQEAAGIRSACGPEFLIVTPGVRPAGASIDDQSRIATPAGAFKNGSSHIVVGRPITKAEDKIAAAQSIVAEIRGV